MRLGTYLRWGDDSGTPLHVGRVPFRMTRTCPRYAMPDILGGPMGGIKGKTRKTSPSLGPGTLLLPTKTYVVGR